MSQPLLQDKVAIVTGAGSGIGRACALRLALEGAKVLLSSPLPSRSRLALALALVLPLLEVKSSLLLSYLLISSSLSSYLLCDLPRAISSPSLSPLPPSPPLSLSPASPLLLSPLQTPPPL